MSPTEIEFAVRDLVAKPHDPATFPFDLIGIYNASKVTVGRLKIGQTNAAKQPGDVLWKKHLFFRPAGPDEDVGAIGDALAADPLTLKHKPRFILVTNGEQVHARDMQLGDTLNAAYAQFDENSDFLLPLAGYERRAAAEEHPADIKAAKKLKKLYDAILAANPTWNTGHHTHELNLLMTRLLFCFYAEDTGIFDTPQIFTNTVTQYTSEDGGDVAALLDRLFRIMNVEVERFPKNTPAAEAKFPYVNGSLFEETLEIPNFTRTARRQLLECGDLDWTTINPDIFGSMIQTVAQDGTRSDLGMHYTSVPNILKVLQPLFLDALDDAYEKAKDSESKLEALLGRLSRIRVFDPACGSGNFLIISYKALRKLEMQVLIRISDLTPKAPFRLSGVSLNNFYGIDIVDFACETAKLSLWIAEHQMNTVFKETFGSARPTLPLGTISTIHRGNATRLPWLTICPKAENAEIYICGNPPYKGAPIQTSADKSDLAHTFAKITSAYKNLDYVACWFYNASYYIRNSANAKAALVSTNSICQGAQVALLWPLLLWDSILEINFAHTSFKWANNAAHNAGVICAIIGLSRLSTAPKHIYKNGHIASVKHINPYLLPINDNVVVSALPTPISDIPEMVKGSEPCDGGHLILSPIEYRDLIGKYPEARRVVRIFMGSEDFLNHVLRYCLLITDEDLDLAFSIPPIKARIEAVGRARCSAGSRARAYAAIPHKFSRRTYRETAALIIPAVSSERREYLQVGLLNKDTVVNNLAFAVYQPPPYLLAILSSRLHRIWAETVGGKLKTDIRYSNTLVYNTFPVSALSDSQKTVLGDNAKAILKARATYPGKSIAWLYNPETMPISLVQAHHENDAYIEEYIYGRLFNDDTQRLERLFTLYERMRAKASNDGTFLAKMKAVEA